MHNYLDSGSIENQSIHSQQNEHLDDTDIHRRRHVSDTDQRLKENRKDSIVESVNEESEDSKNQEETEQKESGEVVSDDRALIDFEDTGQTENVVESSKSDEFKNEQNLC